MKRVFTHLAHYIETQRAIAEGAFELSWGIQKILKLQQPSYFWGLRSQFSGIERVKSENIEHTPYLRLSRT